MDNTQAIPVLIDPETLLVSDTSIGSLFDRNGRRWRVTARTDTFIIGTAIDAVFDEHGEPVRGSDIIKVIL